MIAPGMRQRAVFTARAPGTDANGQPQEVWTAVATRWCDVRTPTGLQVAQAGGETSTTRASLRLRWCTDILPGMRATVGGSTWEVLTVTPDIARRRHVDIVCQQVAA